MYNPDAHSQTAHDMSGKLGPAPLRHDGHDICVWDAKPSIPPNWPEVSLGYGQFGQAVYRPMQCQDAICFLLRAVSYLTLPGIVPEWTNEVVLQSALTLLEARAKIGPMRFSWEKNGVEEQVE